MAKQKLTKSAIDALTSQPTDVVYWDETLAGFGLKVTAKGKKVFIVIYRTRDGTARLRKYTIGTYGPTTPMAATARQHKGFWRHAMKGAIPLGKSESPAASMSGTALTISRQPISPGMLQISDQGRKPAGCSNVRS